MPKKYQTIAEYIADFPEPVASLLEEISQLIQQTVPTAEACISYNMPAFKYNKKVLVYFAGYAQHIGFYALPSGNAAFQNELKGYKVGKGSIQFPLSQPMPLGLIQEIVRFRVAELTPSS